MKRIFSALLLCLFVQTNVFASLSIEDLNSSKDAFYRLGTSDKPEIKYDFEIYLQLNDINELLTIKESYEKELKFYNSIGVNIER